MQGSQTSGRTRTQRVLARLIIQPYWRFQRGLTLGAQGVVIDAEGRVLMVRHGYRPGWCFPGGGVEKGETIATALARELEEECGVALDGDPELFGIYSNGRDFPGDHVALYLVRHWYRTRIPAPTFEIEACEAFLPTPPPADCNPGTARRLAEVFAGAPRSDLW